MPFMHSTHSLILSSLRETDEFPRCALGGARLSIAGHFRLRGRDLKVWFDPVLADLADPEPHSPQSTGFPSFERVRITPFPCRAKTPVSSLGGANTLAKTRGLPRIGR